MSEKQIATIFPKNPDFVGYLQIELFGHPEVSSKYFYKVIKRGSPTVFSQDFSDMGVALNKASEMMKKEEALMAEEHKLDSEKGCKDENKEKK